MPRTTTEVLDPPPATLPPVPHRLPDYLERTYHWAYLRPRSVRWLDRPAVVSAILWGNACRLMRAAVDEFEPGQQVLQAACVYGDFSPMLAERVGPEGRLLVLDAAPIQLDNLRAKTRHLPQVQGRCADLAAPALGIAPGSLDAVACFFLLHEVPPEARRQIVDNLLSLVRVGGKVVITDYHRPARWHPLRPVMAAVFRWLEPFANGLLDEDLTTLSAQAPAFTWSKRTVFGGLYQQVVAVRHH